MQSLKASLFTGLFVLGTASAQQVLFTVNCQPLEQQRADPIISPGQVSSHVHAVIGGTNFQQTMSQSTAVQAKATTCDKSLDNSNYWQPQLYHINSANQFQLVNFNGAAAYYMNRACDYQAGATSCAYNNYALPLAPPAGLRMVAGDPTLRTYNASSVAQQAISHMCLQQSTSFHSNGLPDQPCLTLRAQVNFPSCWDGVNLDSADHKSHVSYPVSAPDGGVCPQSHPKAIIEIFTEFDYDVAGSGITDANLVYAMGDKTGYGLHADFINGWTDQTRLQNALATCTGSGGVDTTSCSLATNGKAGSASRQTPQVPTISENIGLNGPIAALPGNNPVTGTLPTSRKVRRDFAA